MKKVLFTGDTLSSETRDLYRNKGFDIVSASYDLTEDEVAKLLQDCDGYILGGDEIASESLLAKSGEKLKAISFFGAGYEKYIDIKYAKEKGITVSNTPGANANSVAEMTVALLLAAVKNIVQNNNATKRAEWDRQKSIDILGKVVGIIGLGTVGTKVAKMLHNGFGCEIRYFGNNKKPEVEKEIGAVFCSLDQLLSESDFVLVHAAYTENTERLLNEERLKSMKNGAILVNTARAEIVDEDALLSVLKEDVLLRAAFDVFFEEPINSEEILGRHPILALGDDKFIITPHMAYYTHDALENMEKMALDNIVAMLSGADCECIVNK